MKILLLAAALALAAAPAGITADPGHESERIAPTIIMLYGGDLEKPVFVTDFETKLTFYRGIERKYSDEVPSRRASDLRFSFFWDFRIWAPYLRDPELLGTLKPEDGVRGEVFFGEQVLIRYHGAKGYQRANDDVVTIIERHGVQARVAGGAQPDRR